MVIESIECHQIPNPSYPRLPNTVQSLSSKRIKYFLRCYYITLVVLSTVVFVAGCVRTFGASYKHEHNKTIGPQILSPSDRPVNQINQQIPLNKKLIEFKGRPLLVRSNPYHLSLDQVKLQFQTAKISALKNRVKRFACWHSCFGQFRKKAIRTLNGPPIQLFPTDRSLLVSVKDGTPDQSDLKARKREALLVKVSDNGPLSNDLGEGAPERTGQSPTGKSTKEGSDDDKELKVEVETSVDESSIEESEESEETTTEPSRTTQTTSTTFSPTTESTTEMKTSSTTSPPGNKSETTSSPKKDDPNGKQDEEYGSSYEGSEEDDGAVEGSQTVNGKGDGIDEKDLEEEERSPK